ncbi:signal peptidase I [Rickettsiales bacterium]|nr:signal peptidase I [Rickettsiales bacterium]
MKKNVDDKHKVKKTGTIRDTVSTLLWSIGIAVVIRIFAFDPFFVPSGSMIKTLLPGDRMIATKWSYGYSTHSSPFGLPIKNKIFKQDPRYGDVVIFKLINDKSTFYVKRVIGKPGDKVQIINDNVHINGVSLKTKVVKKITKLEYDKISNQKHYDYFASKDSEFEITKEYTIDGKRSYTVINSVEKDIHSNTKEFHVPKGHYFVMGDNRSDSLDSRFSDIGYIDENAIIAKPVIIMFSTEGSMIDAVLHPSTIRFNRFLKQLNK